MKQSFIRATEFGAVPDTGEDSTEAVRKAIAYCRENGIGKLVFERGRYDFKHPTFLDQYDKVMKQGVHMDLGQSSDQKVIAFELEDMDHFEWDGGLASFVFHGLAQPFAFVRCRGLLLHRFTVDWERPLFSVGTVRSTDGSSAEIELLEGNEVDGAVPVAALINYDPASKYPLIGSVESFSQIERTEQSAPNRLKLFYSKPQSMEPGMHLLLRHVLNYRMGILLYECEQVRVRDVTLHYTPGMGIIGHRCEGLEFVRLSVKPSKGRILSTNTDATHFISCKGHIAFDECYFEGMGDDAVNVHGFYYKPVRKIDEYTVEAEANVEIHAQSEKTDYPDIGDRIEWVSRGTMEPFAEGEVVDVRMKEGGILQIRFRNPVPDFLMASGLMANATRSASLSIANCTVRNNRARAFLVQTRNVRIENCTLDHCTGTAIHVTCSIHWYESLTVSDVTIRNNVFRGCGFGAGTIGGAGVMVISAECDTPTAYVQRNIRFEDNVVYGRQGLGISIQSAEGVTIEKNRFMDCHPIAVIDRANEVAFENNEYGSGGGVIVVGREIAEGAITLGDEHCRIVLK
ncbi:right-handed parallel beta-helix repeat-containing protein [Paenibacillus sp. LHD-117]|uniref:right-handed parallel beta-helix repeat-containing protein n=1 Tax=Paenibacillus sp. LHD-117 TaxID=3071412 RepID=UPI0027E0A82F|nr:right-handed parallel beta-helix repeat-containing protein [Paenibacillus sp. LHD-117]MDQ6420554.1 right-handed parallel beta-helix repeat-containing protein [Paenibacillus sp. LHD-117]